MPAPADWPAKRVRSRTSRQRPAAWRAGIGPNHFDEDDRSSMRGISLLRSTHASHITCSAGRGGHRNELQYSRLPAW